MLSFQAYKQPLEVGDTITEDSVNSLITWRLDAIPIKDYKTKTVTINPEDILYYENYEVLKFFSKPDYKSEETNYVLGVETQMVIKITTKHSTFYCAEQGNTLDYLTKTMRDMSK